MKRVLIAAPAAALLSALIALCISGCAGKSAAKKAPAAPKAACCPCVPCDCDGCSCPCPVGIDGNRDVGWYPFKLLLRPWRHPDTWRLPRRLGPRRPVGESLKVGPRRS